MELKSEVRIALEQINFIERYRALSRKYDFDFEERFINYDNQEVIRILDELGYTAKHDRRENFFKVVDNNSLYKFQFNISLKYSKMEFIWAVWIGKELQTGSPWGLMKKRLDGIIDDKIRSITFRNYTDLKGILREAFIMYEDFRRELLFIYSNQQEI